MNIGKARKLHVEAHNAITKYEISSFDGDYGERIVHKTIGGKLMPPTTKGHDIEHPGYGRVQVKTRTLLDRSGARPNTETRAVVGKNLEFDILAHLILDRNLEVKDLILVPRVSIEDKLNQTKGKIRIVDSKNANRAEDLSEMAKVAQQRLDKE